MPYLFIPGWLLLVFLTTSPEAVIGVVLPGTKNEQDTASPMVKELLVSIRTPLMLIFNVFPRNDSGPTPFKPWTPILASIRISRRTDIFIYIPTFFKSSEGFIGFVI